MDERNKAAFWLAAVGAFLIVCIPSTAFIEALSRYRKYVAGVEPAALRPVKVRLVPHRDGRPSGPEPKPRLDFVEFALKKPKAKKVSLIGDFNGWKEGGLPLQKSGERWELMLPLPPGRHHYLFVVDGEPQLDPSNPRTAEVDGRKASVKEIK